MRLLAGRPVLGRDPRAGHTPVVRVDDDAAGPPHRLVQHVELATSTDRRATTAKASGTAEAPFFFATFSPRAQTPRTTAALLMSATTSGTKPGLATPSNTKSGRYSAHRPAKSERPNVRVKRLSGASARWPSATTCAAAGNVATATNLSAMAAHVRHPTRGDHGGPCYDSVPHATRARPHDHTRTAATRLHAAR